MTDIAAVEQRRDARGGEVKDPGKLRYWRMEGLEMQLLGGEVRYE